MDAPDIAVTPSAALEQRGARPFARTKLEWVPIALPYPDKVDELHKSIRLIAQYAKELTPGSEKITGNAVRALLAPIPLPSLMDKEDTKDCLKYVADKVVTRAAKRKA